MGGIDSSTNSYESISPQWSRFESTVNGSRGVRSGEPGLGRACAKGAVDHEIICWGCDQLGTDPFPFETEGEALPMHLEMLTKTGIRLMENIYRDEIAKQKIYEFFLLAAPLKIKGGTASPIRLLAIV